MKKNELEKKEVEYKFSINYILNEWKIGKRIIRFHLKDSVISGIILNYDAYNIIILELVNGTIEDYKNYTILFKHSIDRMLIDTISEAFLKNEK